MKEEASLEYKATQAQQRELLASQKRREDARERHKEVRRKDDRHKDDRQLDADSKRGERDRDRGRRRSASSKASSQRTGFVGLESRSSSSSEESTPKRSRSVITPPVDAKRSGDPSSAVPQGEKEKGKKKEGVTKKKEKATKKEGKKKKKKVHKKRATTKKKRHASVSTVSSSDSEDTDDAKSDKLTRQMMGSLGRRSKFTHFDKKHFSSAAKLFVRAGFSSWAAISKLDEETRRFLRGDLRGKFRCTALDLSLINDIFTHYENEKTAADLPRS